MTKLTEEQISFLADKCIPMDRVFDATDMRPPKWQQTMSEQGMWIAYGVAPCEAKGHTLRTRAGHCVQCKPDKISYLRRHDEAGTVYVAHSPNKKIVKVGSAQRTDRIDQLNYYRYGGTQDWRKEFVIACERAGKVESFAQQSLRQYTVTGTYFKDGRHIECCELFNCELPVAISAVKEALKAVVSASVPETSVASDSDGKPLDGNKTSGTPVSLADTRNTVALLAADLKIPVEVLLNHLHSAGLVNKQPHDVVMSKDKHILLEYLRFSAKVTQTIAVNVGRKRVLVKRDGTRTLLASTTKVLAEPSNSATSHRLMQEPASANTVQVQRIRRFPRGYILSEATVKPLETSPIQYETLTASEALQAHKADGLPPKYGFEVTMYLSDPEYPSHWMTLERWMTMGDDRPDIRWVMERYRLAKQWLEKLDADHARLRRETAAKSKPVPPTKSPSLSTTALAPDMMKLTPDHARKLKGFIEKG